MYQKTQRREEPKKEKPAETVQNKKKCKCFYPSCMDEAVYGQFCEFHHQEERYTSR